jgi:hypothetical protein
MGTNVEQRTRISLVAGRFLAPSFLALLAAVPSIAAAHMGSTKSIDAAVTETGAHLDVRIDAVDAALAVGLPVTAAPERLLERQALLGGWLTGGLVVATDGGVCTPNAGAPIIDRSGDKPVVSVGVDFTCPEPLTNPKLRDDTVFDSDPDHEVFVAVAGTAGSTGAVLRADTREVALGTVPSAWQTTKNFLNEGAIHLVTGYDHLLFLLSLILGAGLAAKRFGLRRSMKDVAWVVTAFTVGHSISLVLSSLGILSLPSQLVESVIAASIVFVAALNIIKPEARVARPQIAAAFGIVHGFGFSSVLADVGLPAAHRALALGAFNVGIELAQLAFVAVVMLPLVWAAKHRQYPLVVVRGGSVAIAALGCVWLVERGLGL